MRSHGYRCKLAACLLDDAEMALGMDGWAALDDPFPAWDLDEEEPAT